VLELDDEQGGKFCGLAPLPFQQPWVAGWADEGAARGPALALPTMLRVIASTRQIVPA
jgi:hypothetical protein